MKLRSAGMLLSVLFATGIAPAARADVARTAAPAASMQRLDDLVVMTPTPTRAAAPGLRMRTDVWRPDHLWTGIQPPSFVPLTLGDLRLDLLDATPSGGYVATYRERYASSLKRGQWANRRVTVKAFDTAGHEVFSADLDRAFPRKDHLEVQDVRYAEARDGVVGTLYYNEACQTYSKDAGGRCSFLVAMDPATKKILWRTSERISNNYFLVVNDYLVAAYGFTSEPATIHVIRRSDGHLLDTHALPGTNFEMATSGDVLSVEMYYRIGTGHFRMLGFDGPSPKLVALPTTPPDPNDKPTPYDPPLLPDPSARAPSIVIPAGLF